MIIYNSLTNKKEKFSPIKEGNVSMYVCGPTVYSYIHIGNARPVIFFDVVRRYFEFIGYNVNYVSNITDVDDKIIKAALKAEISEDELTGKFLNAYLDDQRKLNSLLPHSMPKATEYMNSIIEYISKLIEADYAYESNGDVYFRVAKLSNYGVLSNQNIDDLEMGARIEINEKKRKSS